LYSACRDHTSKALRYGTRSQWISQFNLHIPRTSANGMNHTCPVPLPFQPYKAIEFREITQNKGYYAVQGNSRSPMSVAIESPYATFY